MYNSIHFQQVENLTLNHLLLQKHNFRFIWLVIIHADKDGAVKLLQNFLETAEDDTALGHIKTLLSDGYLKRLQGTVWNLWCI